MNKETNQTNASEQILEAEANGQAKEMTTDKLQKAMAENQAQANPQTKEMIDELQKALSESQAKVQEHWDRVLRMQAEMDNLSRRAEKDIANAHKYALEKFVSELLPVIDSLELSLNPSNSNENSAQAVLEGVALTLKMFQASLEKFGVTVVNPVGELFDPGYSQAISTQVDVNVQSGTVLSVLQKGYVLNQRLLRAALVVVSKKE